MKKYRPFFRSKRARARIDYLLNLTAQELGHSNERRVVEAYSQESASLFPQWIQSARLATKYEDRYGKDVVSTTDAGEIFVQIKGSQIGKKKFFARQNKGLVDWRIITVAIYPSHLPEKIREIITPLLEKEYGRLLADKGLPAVPAQQT